MSPSPAAVLLAFAAFVTLGAAVVAVRAAITWKRVGRGPGRPELDLVGRAHQQAFADVMAARSRHASAVDAHDRRLAEARTSVGAGGGVDLGADLVELANRREDTAQALAEAQRRWEETAPSPGPRVPIGLWSGRGVLCAWQFGPVGYEVFSLRLQHALDPSCWSTWQGRRFRFGLGFGAERIGIAGFALGASMRELPELVTHGFGGPEAGIRPGLPLGRWFRLRSRNATARAAAKALLAETADGDLHQPASPDARAAVHALFGEELGRDLDEVTSLPAIDPQLSLVAIGPSVLAGAWWGPLPEVRRVAGSAHTAWAD